MAHRHLKIISGSAALFFFAGCVLGNSVFGAGSEGSAALSEDEKRFIMSADKMKKQKKAESEKKSSSHKKCEKEKLAPPKKMNRGED